MAKPLKRAGAPLPQPQAGRQTVQIQQFHHEGPLPAPEDLQRYEALAPGAAERIIRMAEAEQSHRHALESKALEADASVRITFQGTEDARIKGVFASDRRGQYLGTIVSLSAIVAAVATAVMGIAWYVPIAFLSLPVMGMVKALRAPAGTQAVPAEKHAAPPAKR